MYFLYQVTAGAAHRPISQSIKPNPGATDEDVADSQQTITYYEAGRQRIAVAMLTPLTNTLSVTVEVIFSENTSTKKK